MIFLGYHNALQQRICGTSLKSHMKELMMLRGQESMFSSKSMSFSECRKGTETIFPHCESLDEPWQEL